MRKYNPPPAWPVPSKTDSRKLLAPLGLRVLVSLVSGPVPCSHPRSYRVSCISLITPFALLMCPRGYTVYYVYTYPNNWTSAAPLLHGTAIAGVPIQPIGYSGTTLAATA